MSPPEPTAAERSPAPPGAGVDALLTRLRHELHGAIAGRLGWLALAAIGLIGWLALTLDRLFEPSPNVRFAAEIGLAIGATIWLVVVVGRRLTRRIDDHDIVTLLHRQWPREAALIATSLDLREKPGLAGSEHLKAATLAAADRSAAELTDVSLVRSAQTTGVAWFASVAVGGAALFGVVRPDLVQSYASRVSLAEEGWPRRVRLTVEGFEHNVAAGEWTRVVARGEPAEFTVVAEVDGDDRPPETLWARGGRVGGGRTLSTLTRVGTPQLGETSRQHYRRRFERVDDDLSLVVSGGDQQVRVRLVAEDRPQLTDVMVACQPPGYLQAPPTTVSPTTLTPLPEGGIVTITAGASKRIASVEVSAREASSPGEQQLDAAITEEGRLVVVTPPLAEAIVVTLVATDEHGLTSEPVELPIEVAKDAAPTVQLSLSGVGRAITRDALVPVRVRLEDDHGVSDVRLELRRGDDRVTLGIEPPRVSPATARGGADLLSLRSADRSSRLTLEPGDHVTLTASATDHYDLAERPRAESRPIELEVVPPAELLARIGEAQRELRGALESLLSDVERLEYEVDLRQRRSAEAAPDAGEQQRWVAERLLDTRKAGGGVADAALRADGLRQQVVNNRLDQPDLVDRLQRRVVRPLNEVADHDLAAVSESLSAKSVDRLAAAVAELRTAKSSIERVMASLDTQQTYNEVVALLRGLIREQRRVNEQTARQESESVRSLFD